MNGRQKLEQQLIEKALKDESFRRQLIEDPRAAIEAETGLNIPETLNIKVLEEDSQTVYLVLPDVIAMNGQNELTDEELNGVAGGGPTLNSCYFKC
jgi:hypothetical protein